MSSKPTKETCLLLPSQQSSCSSAVCSPPPLHKRTSGLASGAGWETLNGTFALHTSVRAPEVVWLAPRARRNLVCQLPEFHGRLSSLSRCRSSAWSSSRTLSGSSCCSLFRSHHVTGTVIYKSSQEQRWLRGAPGWSHDARNSVRTATRHLRCLDVCCPQRDVFRANVLFTKKENLFFYELTRACT